MNEKRERGAGRIFRRKHSRFLWIQYYSARGEQIRESAGTDDFKKAEKILRRKIGEVEAGVHRDDRRITYEEMSESYYRDYEINARKSLRRDNAGRPHLDKVARLNEFFSGYRASEIDADLIRGFVAHEQKRGLANGTVNRSVSALRRMFNIAKKDGKLRDLPYFPLAKEAAPRQGFFEREQYEALSRALPDYLRVPLAVGYFTGMRAGEILSLRWNQVDLLSNSIDLRAGETKYDAARTVPIVPQLRTLLLEQRAKRQPECSFVCFRLDRRGHAVNIGSFRKVWQSRCVKLGLGKREPVIDATTGAPLYSTPRGPRSKLKAKMRYSGMIFHDLRRTGVRNLVRAGVPERVAQQISGHRTRSVFERYNIVSANDLADASRKLANFHGEKVGDSSGTFEPDSNEGRTLHN